MTVSFTCMLLAECFIFSNAQERDILTEYMDDIIALSEKGMHSKSVDEILEKPFDGIVYFGAGLFSKMAQEAALKVLELTAGSVCAMYNIPLGWFRHGPKSFVNETTFVICFASSDLYKQIYDSDFIREMRQDNIGRINTMVPRNFSYRFNAFFQLSRDLPDHLAVFPYIICAQMVALKKSVLLGLTPNNPFPTGTVNRVVQGVVIYKDFIS